MDAPISPTALLTRLREARPTLGNLSTQDTFKVFELLAATRKMKCAAALRAMRGTCCPEECVGCGDVRWRVETRAHLLLPVPGRGAITPVDLEDEQLERMDLGGEGVHVYVPPVVPTSSPSV